MTSDIESGGASSGANVLTMVRPLLHDFTYRTCAVCHFPIPAHQLVDDEYRPRHADCDPAWQATAALVQDVA
jgi:hypothetical protein